MSSRNRVVWSEGLFIKPQHFQQQQRFQDYVLHERITSASQYLFGVSELLINPDQLAHGTITIERAIGVMPDGAVINIPREDMMPDALHISDDSVANQVVYLVLPLRSDSLLEVNQQDALGTGRYMARKHETRDVHSIQGDLAHIDVSPHQPRLMLEKQDRSAFASIAIARILEKRPDGSLMLDPHFIPCHLNVVGIPALHRFITEMSGLMRERAKNIAQRIGSPSQGGVADVSDFMLLQALNRLQPQLQHLSTLRSLHPERLYEALVSMCGELASFTDESRMAGEFMVYQHEQPTEAFQALMVKMRQSLSIVLEPRAVSIQLQKRRFGLMVAPIQDQTLLESADFIIAVRARMPLDELRRLFVQQTKVASVEKIRELISLQLPGIPVNPLPVAPRQLPYHAGYTYYQLDKSSQAWRMIQNASGFAFHVAGEFEQLDLQFWAIRS